MKVSQTYLKALHILEEMQSKKTQQFNFEKFIPEAV